MGLRHWLIDPLLDGDALIANVEMDAFGKMRPMNATRFYMRNSDVAGMDKNCGLYLAGPGVPGKLNHAIISLNPRRRGAQIEHNTFRHVSSGKVSS